MAKLGKDKIALFLACASVLGGKTKTQAMNISKVQSPQTIGAVGGARTQPKKINWGKIAKIGGFTVAGLAALETIHSLIGGFTDYKIGSYSIGRAIKNRAKKNEQPEPAKQDDNNKDKPKDKEILVESIENIQNKETNKGVNLLKSKENVAPEIKSNKQFEMIDVNNDMLKKFQEKAVMLQSMLKNFEKLSGNNKENQKALSFSQEVIKKLDEEYHNRFNIALDKIKEHEFTPDQETELKDFLEVLRNDKISSKDSKMMEAEKNMICVTLNSVSYWLNLIGSYIKISKGNNEFVYLKG